jgi:putative transposase
MLKVSGVAGPGSSRSTEALPAHVLATFPFEVRAIQTDNGSEFAHLFDAACQAAGIAHYCSHPRCPKQNAFVERVIRTAIDEFYLLNDTPVDIADHAQALADFDIEYNEVRPHQSLGYLTPSEYHAQWQAAHLSAEETP